MNIKIVDSWLREYLKTDASAHSIAQKLSLTSVSVERVEKEKDDFVYDIEVTTNRPDLMSVVALAREAAAVLPKQETPARFTKLNTKVSTKSNDKFPIEIKNDSTVVNRICAVVMEVEIGKSPTKISERLEKSGIRSINNLVDVTNYVMREVGHPTHVFDYDRLVSKKMIIRESKKGETITTLDGKEYRLYGEDIIADDGTGQIIDLLGVMGTQNSVVTNDTKRILFFIDNNEPHHIRNTSMSLGIRTDAAILNEKGIDPELSMVALERGIELYEQTAKGRVISEILDIYPNKPKIKTIDVKDEKINSIIGAEVGLLKSEEILEKLGFGVKRLAASLEVSVPTIRTMDIKIEEDVIEEIARVFGYQKLPSVVPSFLNEKIIPFANNFYFEQRIKNALKYFGFTEVYTYSLVSENLYQGPIGDAIKLKNPLTEDMAYLRNSLIPSLLQVLSENKKREELKIFEIANTYHKIPKKLPIEKLTLSGVLKHKNISFYEVKGLVEVLLEDIGIKEIKFKTRPDGIGATVYKDKDTFGYIEVLNSDLIDFELNFDLILEHANIKKQFRPLAKFPPIVEDLSVVIDENISTNEIILEIQRQSDLIKTIDLLDSFNAKRTFHITYQSQTHNLTNNDTKPIREKIIKTLQERFKASIN